MVVENLKPDNENFQSVKVTIDNVKREVYLDDSVTVNANPEKIILDKKQVEGLMELLINNGL